MQDQVTGTQDAPGKAWAGEQLPGAHRGAPRHMLSFSPPGLGNSQARLAFDFQWGITSPAPGWGA